MVQKPLQAMSKLSFIFDTEKEGSIESKEKEGWMDGWREFENWSCLLFLVVGLAVPVVEFLKVWEANISSIWAFGKVVSEERRVSTNAWWRWWWWTRSRWRNRGCEWVDDARWAIGSLEWSSNFGQKSAGSLSWRFATIPFALSDARSFNRHGRWCYWWRSDDDSSWGGSNASGFEWDVHACGLLRSCRCLWASRRSPSVFVDHSFSNVRLQIRIFNDEIWWRCCKEKVLAWQSTYSRNVFPVFPPLKSHNVANPT